MFSLESDTASYRASQDMPIVTPLFLIFLILKLCGVIAWSWLWVFSPLLLYAAWLVFFVGLMIAMKFLK